MAGIDAVFQTWRQLIEIDRTVWQYPSGRWIWRITDGESKSYLLECGDQPQIELNSGAAPGDAIGRLSTGDFLSLAEGGENLQQLFLAGRLRLTGDRLAALWFGLLWRRFLEGRAKISRKGQMHV